MSDVLLDHDIVHVANKVVDDYIEAADPVRVIKLANEFGDSIKSYTSPEIVYALALIIGSKLRGVDETSSRIFWAVLAELAKRYLGDPVAPPEQTETP